MIQSVFRAEGLPLDLAYIPIIESAFKTNALSKASAKGPWQFMKATAQENGLKHDWYIDERSDPEKATRRGGEVPEDAAARCSTATGTWCWRPTTAASGRVQRAMKRSGNDDFWELSESLASTCRGKRASTCR